MAEDGAGYGPKTLAIHAGQRPDAEVGARATPIYQTTSFMFEDVEHAASLFDLERPGHIYSRISNPTIAVLEERLAMLEGGVGAIALASGQAALFAAISAVMSAGGHIVASRALYGGSVNLLSLTLPRFGIETTFVDPRDPSAFAAAITPATRLLFVETISNPGLDVADIPALADVARQAGLPLMVDNTFGAAWLCRPLDHGADIVTHSVTKWLGGHGVAIGGALIDGGFDWAASDKFPTLTEPYAGYRGVSFTDTFGRAALTMRARCEGLRDFGACMSPHTAFLLLQGIETLPLRMKAIMENAGRVADHLAGHDAVAWVNYPGRPDHPDREVAEKLMPRGGGGVVCFGLKGGRKAGAAFVDALKLISHLANVGDAKTLAIHPASTTHRQLDADAMAAMGLREDLIRLSIGIEDCDDILADLDQALKKAGRIA